jgi:hypothetical protein
VTDRRGPGRRTLRLGTFDAERWWRPPDLASLPRAADGDARADQVIEAMDECLAVLCRPDDVLVTHRPLPASFVDTLASAGFTFQRRRVSDPALPDVDRLEPYAWLPATADLAERLGVEPPPPPVEVVQAVNSKTWSNQVAADLGLPGVAAVVRSADELADAVAALDGAPTLIKDPFGVAGRGCLEVTSLRVMRAVVRTISKQAAAGRRVELLVQRLLPRRLDFSAHFDVGAGGETTWRGVAVSVGEGRGFGYRGSQPAEPSLMAQLAGTGYDVTMGVVAGRLAAAGYHGPVCVDSLLLDGGAVVPVLEINARLSMGRLCLELDEAVQADGLRARLGLRDVAVRGTGGHGHLVRALRRVGALRRRGAPGVLPLSAGTLVPPRGRLVYAVVAGDDAEASGLERTLDTCLAEAGLLPQGAAAGVA